MPRRKRVFALLVICGAVAVFLASLSDSSPVHALATTTGAKRAHVATGPTVYVDAGSIGGPCSDSRTAAQAAAPTTPLCSIPAGINLAGSGGTVLVRGGTYPALQISGGNRSTAVTVQANGSETVSIPSIDVGSGTGLLRFSGLNLTGSSTVSAFALEDGAHDIQLVNSSVTSPTQDAISLRPAVNNVAIAGNYITTRAPGATTGGDGITFLSTSTLPGSPAGEPNDAPVTNVAIVNNRLVNIGVDAIRPTNFVNLSIQGNEITGVDENGQHTDAIQTVFGGTNLDIEGNYIHDNNGEGILIKDGQVTNARIVNNLFAHTTLEYQLQVTGTSGLVVANNTFWDNAGYGMVLRPGVTQGVVENNIFENLSAAPAYQITGITEDYNLVAGGYGEKFGPHDIQGSPRFVNATGDDFRLAAGSPGIDAADASVAPPFDKACRPRYDAPGVANHGAGSPPYVDMGALEYGPTSQPGDTSTPFMECSATTTPSMPLPTSGIAPLPNTKPPAAPKSFCSGVSVRRGRRAHIGLVLWVRSRQRGRLRIEASLLRARRHRKPTATPLGSARARVPARRTVKATVKLSKSKRERLTAAGARPWIRVVIHAAPTRATACTRTLTLHAA